MGERFSRTFAAIAVALIGMSFLIVGVAPSVADGASPSPDPCLAARTCAFADITLLGSGSGSLASSGGTIDCVRADGTTTGTCSRYYDTTHGSVSLTRHVHVDTGSSYRGAIQSPFTQTSRTLRSGDTWSPTETFSLDSELVTVVPAGTGSGTVTSTPAGIDCGVTCSASFPFGTSLSLAAAASAGSSFGAWAAGPCQGQGSTCTFTVGAGGNSIGVTFTQNATTPPPTAPPTASPAPSSTPKPTPKPTRPPTSSTAPFETASPPPVPTFAPSPGITAFPTEPPTNAFTPPPAASIVAPAPAPESTPDTTAAAPTADSGPPLVVLFGGIVGVVLGFTLGFAVALSRHHP